MGSKKNKNLKDLMKDLHQQVILKGDMNNIIGGTTNQGDRGNSGCGGIVPQ